MKVFKMLTSEDVKRIKKQGDLAERVKELENSLSIALEVNDKFQRENVKLKKRVREAEGETSIVKGIGINSPEMKALQKESEELKKELALVKEDHQYDNLVHAKELKKALER